MTFAPQINSFWFLVMVYDTVDDVDKFSKKKVVLGRIRLKIEAKVFFS